MKLGIVGSEAAKFTPLGEERAKDAIRSLIREHQPSHVVSGHCHLGGIDIYAEEVADELGVEKEIYPPAKLNWDEGYKPRNLQIAHNSDIVVCISVLALPTSYKGMVFKGCYHCERANNAASKTGIFGCTEDHVKSGGCWTVLKGIAKGKGGL